MFPQIFFEKKCDTNVLIKSMGLTGTDLTGSSFENQTGALGGRATGLGSRSGWERKNNIGNNASPSSRSPSREACLQE
jgi:hypothetical protein